MVNASAVSLFCAKFPELSLAFGPLLSRSPELARLGRFPTVAELNAEARRLDLTTADGRPLCFVEAPPKSSRRRRKDPKALSYEWRVAERGEVETRDGSWHDYFNMLTWTAFPQLKAALNARQIIAKLPDEARQLGQVRSREQDRLAIFDEGGVLRVQSRQDEVEYFIVGHALYESLILGKRGIRALVLDVPLSDAPEVATSQPLVTRLDQAQRAGAARIAEGCFAANGIVWPDCLLDDIAL